MNTQRADELYAQMRGHLKRLLEEPRLLVSAGRAWPNAPGVYAMFEHGECVYVGRAKNVRSRMKNHSAASAGHNKASFAFRLAREAVGAPPPTYRTIGSRRARAEDPEFRAVFANQRSRVGNMQAAFIELPNDEAQAVFELYAALCLDAKYFDFATH